MIPLHRLDSLYLNVVFVFAIAKINTKNDRLEENYVIGDSYLTIPRIPLSFEIPVMQDNKSCITNQIDFVFLLVIAQIIG